MILAENQPIVSIVCASDGGDRWRGVRLNSGLLLQSHVHSVGARPFFPHSDAGTGSQLFTRLSSDANHRLSLFSLFLP